MKPELAQRTASQYASGEMARQESDFCKRFIDEAVKNMAAAIDAEVMEAVYGEVARREALVANLPPEAQAPARVLINAALGVAPSSSFEEWF